MEITELIERAKRRANLSSDYALAKAIGKHTGTVANWRNGKQHPSNEEAVQLATLAGLDEMSVIAEIELRTAKTEKKKEFWKNYIESRGLGNALKLCIMGLILIFTPESSEASILHNETYAYTNIILHNIHYAYFKPMSHQVGLCAFAANVSGILCIIAHCSVIPSLPCLLLLIYSTIRLIRRTGARYAPKAIGCWMICSTT